MMMTNTNPNIPVLVRVAGLSASALDAMGSPRCIEALDAIAELSSELDQLRAACVEQLYQSVPLVDSDERGFFLKLKRNCFNGKLITGMREHESWYRAAELTHGLIERIAKLETRVEARKKAYRQLIRDERLRERQSLLPFTEHRELLRGISLASPLLAESLPRFRECLGRPGRRERRTEISFLRYVSRSALKLSPFSTLTPLAMADVGHAVEGDGKIRFRRGRRDRRSLVRVKRYLLDQCCNLLFWHPGIRKYLPVGLNNSLEILDDGQYRFLRSYHLEVEADEQGSDLKYSQPSQVTLQLSGALAPELQRRLATGPIPFGELNHQLAEVFGDDISSQIQELLSDLVNVGFLMIIQPWAGYEPHLEGQLLTFLEGLPYRTVPHAVLDLVRDLVRIELDFADLDDHPAVVRCVDSLVTRLYDLIREEFHQDSSLELQKKEGRNYYEDVFLTPEGSVGTVLELDGTTMRRAVEAGSQLWRLGFCFEPRHEMMLALEHHSEQIWPDRRRVQFTQFFVETRSLWRDFLTHLDEQPSEVFDPFGLESVARLGRIRAAVRQQLRAMAQVTDDTEHYSLDAVRDLAGTFDQRFVSPVGACVFLQPCDPEGRRWVANRVFEGTGRMSCRFNVLLEGEVLRQYVRHYEERSVFDYDGEQVELLDMLYTKANTVNIHWPQTRKVLLTPGETCELPPDRQLKITDLFVERRIGDGKLRVVDAEGHVYIPCFLSSLHTPFMPNVLKFLDLFGVNARGNFRLPSSVVQTDQFHLVRRQEVGDLVLRRRRWIIPRDEIPGLDDDEASGFAAIQGWRRALGLPRQVYLIEKVAETTIATDVFKPQYVDFDSPTFVQLFRDSVRLGDPEVSLDEALPRPQDFPVDPEVGPRAFEVMLEALAFEPPSKPTLPVREPVEAALPT